LRTALLLFNDYLLSCLYFDRILLTDRKAQPKTSTHCFCIPISFAIGNPVRCIISGQDLSRVLHLIVLPSYLTEKRAISLTLMRAIFLFQWQSGQGGYLFSQSISFFAECPHE